MRLGHRAAVAETLQARNGKQAANGNHSTTPQTMKYNKTVRTVIITPEDDTDSPIFSEKAISVSVEDEAGGPFIVLKTNDEVSGRGEVRLDVEELEEAAKVARELMGQETLREASS